LYKLKRKIPNIRNVYTEPAQDFKWKHSYDMIYVGGMVELLTDLDLLKFLINARNHLNKGGKLFLKENILQEDILQINPGKGQKFRQLKVYQLFYLLAGLRFVYLKISDGHPLSFYPVYEMILEADN